jgi:hypothetical protein
MRESASYAVRISELDILKSLFVFVIIERARVLRARGDILLCRASPLVRFQAGGAMSHRGDGNRPAGTSAVRAVTKRRVGSRCPSRRRATAESPAGRKWTRLHLGRDDSWHLCFLMTERREWVEWDFLPEADGASRTSPQALDLRLQVRGARGGAWPPRRRSPYDRFLSAYLRVLIGALRIVAGAAAGVVVVVGGWFVVMVIRHL